MLDSVTLRSPHPLVRSRAHNVRPPRTARDCALLLAAAALVSACGGGGGSGGAPSPPPAPPTSLTSDNQSGFEFTVDSATAAVASTFGLVLTARGQVEFAVWATNVQASALRQGIVHPQLECVPKDSGDPPILRWDDQDRNARVSGGDNIVVSGGTCGDQIAANLELGITAYVEDEFGAIDLAGRLTFSRSFVDGDLPSASADGSVTLDYAAPEGRMNVASATSNWSPRVPALPNA